MTMTEQEIVKDYREAKDKKTQIGILADLNTCSKQQIVEILKVGGVDHRELPRIRKRKEESASEEKKPFSLEEKEESEALDPLVRQALLFYKKQLATEREEELRQLDMVRQLLSEHEASVRILDEGIAKIERMTQEDNHA